MEEDIDKVSSEFHLLFDNNSFFNFTHSLKNRRNLETRKNICEKNYKLYRTAIHSDTFSRGVLPRKSLNEILMCYEGKFPLELEDIFKEFVDYVEPVNLEHCLRNIGTVKVNLLQNDKHNCGVNGDYNPKNNSINLYRNNKSTLCHEFLHMASSSINLPYSSGFSVFKCDYLEKKADKFGSGLNEGYTELLNLRIFGGDKDICSYNNNVKIVRLIECFFDDYRDMEYAYFHNDIDAVYKAFFKYGTRAEYFMIMNELDLYASSCMFSDMFYSLKTQLKLYEIILRSGDADKIKQFEEILNENLDGKLAIFKGLNSYHKQLKKMIKKARNY